MRQFFKRLFSRGTPAVLKNEKIHSIGILVESAWQCGGGDC